MESSGANSLNHFAHGHPLVLLQERIDKDSTCSGCNALLLTGSGTAPYYACQSCRFYLHQRCAAAPSSKKFPSVHRNHVVRLGFQASRRGKRCDVCPVSNVNNYIVGLFYECRPCDFDAHISCVAPWRDNRSDLYHFAHNHPLQPLQDEVRGEPICDGCKSQLFSEPRTTHHFACQECDFYLDFQCAAAPSSKHFPSVHRHPLSLGFKASRGGKLCDVCTQRNAVSNGNYDTYIVGLFYECRECDFDVHISCVEPRRGKDAVRSNDISSQHRYRNLSSEFESLGIRRNPRELQGRNAGDSSSNTTPPSCPDCNGHKGVADKVLDLVHQVAESRTDPDPEEYQKLLQHFKDTFPTADANTLSAIAIHLRFPSNQMVYKSMMSDSSTLRSYIRRVLDPRSAPPINMSFLYSSPPTQDQIVTGRSV